MLMTRNALLFLLSFLLFAGCVSTSTTNLTPSRQVRSPDGLYPFEVAWKSTQQSLKDESLKAYLIMGHDTYPMEPTKVVKNRWETQIPIPADVKFVTYRYKFDFEFYGIGNPKKDSKLSPSYELKIVDK
jgi:hypothetical protein